MLQYKLKLLSNVVQDVDYLIEADVSTGADDNSFDGYQGADVPQTAGYVQGYAPHTDIIQNSKGKRFIFVIYYIKGEVNELSFILTQGNNMKH